MDRQVWSPLRLQPQSYQSPPPSAPWNCEHSLQTFSSRRHPSLSPPAACLLEDDPETSSGQERSEVTARSSGSTTGSPHSLWEPRRPPPRHSSKNPVSAAPVHHPAVWPVSAVTETGDARSVGRARHLHAGFCPQLNTTTHKFTQTKTNTVTMTAHVCLMMQKEPEVTQNRDSRRSTEEKIIHIQSLHIKLMTLIMWFSTVWT